MLFRDVGDDAIAIPQPSHAWLSGQLLRAWGNGTFAPATPYEEVCLGAELHDIGWLSWEAAPTLNPQTARPHSFQELGAAIHTGLWTDGVQRALAFGRYPALLVSLHADTIYGSFFDFAKATTEDAALVRRFLDDQHRFQRACIEALSDNPRYATALSPQAVERNRLLVAAVDRMSLEIGWGLTDEARIPNVPTAGEARTEVRLRSPSGNPADLVVDPWPFAADRVEVLCEGRLLRGRFTDEGAMRRALDSAKPVTILTVLKRP
ncbi:DUF3891 family protein [Azospirillum rugosum]|uniref:DUF3891 domain-containing protein n=1 Tax=Azospirillum rugosum TaxID=416170 RepID=A0ABS4SH16_9PROT|nr:DUF3891 family protein [Azospirillum rugosum]MBP2291864.1 hypothetical protein [Azospirillum rugosum]MDQ0524324.1 hypothetical protein [Azospirillum rugosum]